MFAASCSACPLFHAGHSWVYHKWIGHRYSMVCRWFDTIFRGNWIRITFQGCLKQIWLWPNSPKLSCSVRPIIVVLCSCRNGTSIESADHKENMSYPVPSVLNDWHRWMHIWLIRLAQLVRRGQVLPSQGGLHLLYGFIQNCIDDWS